jgi:hypothetical protein
MKPLLLAAALAFGLIACSKEPAPPPAPPMPKVEAPKPAETPPAATATMPPADAMKPAETKPEETKK